MQQLFCRAYQARNVAPTTKTLSSRRTTISSRGSSSFLTTTTSRTTTTTTRKKRGKRIDVHTRCGLSENAAGILLLSLIDDIAFIGLTASTSKSAMERLNEGGHVGDISTTTMTTTTTTVFGMLALLAGCVVATAIHPGETSSKDEIFIFEKKKKKKKKKTAAAAAGKKTRR